MPYNQAIADIAAERERQINVEGWAHEHDDKYTDNELGRAAASYAMADMGPDAQRASVIGELWPWDFKWWKPHDRRRNLVKAGALIAAEIERIDRAAARTNGE